MGWPDGYVVIEKVAPQLRRYRLTEKLLLERVQATAERGVAIDEGSAAVDVTAIGRPILDKSGNAVAAVFVASIRARMVEGRLREVDKRLQACVGTIQARLPR
jgi:DNA-binding IclR family transcriptional regulator